jgi:hypothetical protein
MEKENRIRKPYKKPEVHQVKLEIEEAVLQACKVSTETAKTNKACNHPACKRTGS